MTANRAKRVVAVVQARMGSSRLPGKVLADVGEQPLLRVLLGRLAEARTLDAVAVATTTRPEDDPLADAVTGWGYPVVRGSSDDVLDRYRLAAAELGAEIVVRVTGDCPLIDPRVVDDVVRVIEDDDADYASLDETFPDGADVEAMTVEALMAAARSATKSSHREHVTPWLRERQSDYSVHTLTSAHPELADARLTVDEPADLRVIRTLADRLGLASDVSIWDYARNLMQDSELLAGREGWTRNEGLWRSRNRDELENIGLKHGRARSDELAERAARVIPSSTQTLSKASDQFVRGVTPTFLQSGSGCHVTDVDGNVFIDYPMALGPIILGYNHPRTVEAVTRQMACGTTFTLPHPLEVEVAELITEVVPCAEMVRFAKNGSDATDGAVRLARAVTGRDTVLACGYHGWHDWYVVQTARSDGVPSVLAEYIKMFPFNDLDAVRSLLDAHRGDVAAVILELGFDEPAPGYLEELRRLTHEAGAVLVYDEIVTGFRLALGGAQEHYGVTPDVACLGKAMANGLPLAAVVGARQVMQGFDRVFFSGTFGGETLSLAAAKVTIAEIRDAPVIEHMWTQGARLHAGLRESIAHNGLEISVIGQPPRGGLLFRHQGQEWPALRGLFLQETVKRGVLFGGPVFVTYAHDAADIDRTVEICDEVFGLMAKAVASDAVERLLEGPAPGVVFRLPQS